jgi:hypothetical protein
MATQLPHVRPGDLITAVQINSFIDQLNDCQQRLDALQSGGSGPGNAVTIFSLIPPSGTIRVGDILTVLGTNFGFSVGAQRVYIDDTRVDSFESGSGDQTLIFRIPLTITNVPAIGRPAILTVSNATSTAQRTLSLQSPVVLAGNVDVNPQGVQPATPLAAKPVTFQFQLISQANLDADYTLAAVVTAAANQSDWQNAAHVLDSDQTTEIKSVHLAAGQQKTVYVRLNQIPLPLGTNNVPFGIALNVQATSGNAGGSSGTHNYVVGSAAPQPDTTITISTPSIEVVSGTGSVNATAVTVSSGGVVNLSYPLTFTVAGTYDIKINFLSGAANWDVAYVQPPGGAGTENQQQILGTELNNPKGMANKNIVFSLRRNANATAGEIELVLNNQSSILSTSRRMQLTLG